MSFNLASLPANATADQIRVWLEAEIPAINEVLDRIMELPIGSFIFTSVDENPGNVIGYGVWEPYAIGRLILN